MSIQTTPKQAQAAAKQYGTDGKALFDAYCARCHTLGWSYRDSYPEPDSKSGCGAYGPNLCDGDEIRQFPDAKDQLQFIQLGSDFAKNYGVRGIGNGRMPGFADDPNRATATQKPGCNNAVCTTYRLGPMLTTAQIQAIVEYERSL